MTMMRPYDNDDNVVNSKTDDNGNNSDNDDNDDNGNNDENDDNGDMKWKVGVTTCQ